MQLPFSPTWVQLASELRIDMRYGKIYTCLATLKLRPEIPRSMILSWCSTSMYTKETTICKVVITAGNGKAYILKTALLKSVIDELMKAYARHAKSRVLSECWSLGFKLTAKSLHLSDAKYCKSLSDPKQLCANLRCTGWGLSSDEKVKVYPYLMVFWLLLLLPPEEPPLQSYDWL